MKEYSSYFHEQHYLLKTLIEAGEELVTIREFLHAIDDAKMTPCEMEILEFVYYQHEQRTIKGLIDGLRENLGKKWSYLSDKQIKRQIETLKKFFPNYQDY